MKSSPVISAKTKRAGLACLTKSACKNWSGITPTSIPPMTYRLGQQNWMVAWIGLKTEIHHGILTSTQPKHFGVEAVLSGSS